MATYEKDMSTVEKNIHLKKEIISVFLAEYKHRTTEILKHAEFQQNILRMQIVLLSAVFAAIIKFIEPINRSTDEILLLFLISPIPFHLLSISNLNHSLKVSENAKYIHQVIKKAIEAELGNQEILNWELFLFHERRKKYEFYPLLRLRAEFWLPLIIPYTSVAMVPFFCFFSNLIPSVFKFTDILTLILGFSLWLLNVFLLLYNHKTGKKVGKEFMDIASQIGEQN